MRWRPLIFLLVVCWLSGLVVCVAGASPFLGSCFGDWMWNTGEGDYGNVAGPGHAITFDYLRIDWESGSRFAGPVTNYRRYSNNTAVAGWQTLDWSTSTLLLQGASPITPGLNDWLTFDLSMAEPPVSSWIRLVAYNGQQVVDYWRLNSNNQTWNSLSPSLAPARLQGLGEVPEPAVAEYLGVLGAAILGLKLYRRKRTA